MRVFQITALLTTLTATFATGACGWNPTLHEARRAPKRPPLYEGGTGGISLWWKYCYFVMRSFFTSLTPFTPRAISPAFLAFSAESTKPLS